MNFRFQTRSTMTESFDSVSSVAGRPTRGRPVAAIRRRRPRLSAPTPSLGRHDATPSLGRPHFASPALPLTSISPRRAPPRTSSLARASLAVSDQESQPNTSPKLPLPRRHLLGHCRAQVRRHCRAPSRSSSPEFRPSSPATWPGLSDPPFLSILVPIAFPWLTDARREPQPGRHRLCTPAYRPQRRRAAIHAVEPPRAR